MRVVPRRTVVKGSFSNGNGNENATKQGLNFKKNCAYAFLYISLPSPAKQQREIINDQIQGFFGEREHTTVNFLFSFPT